MIEAETAEREVRSVEYQLKLARFPAYRDLAGFDFAHSEVNEAMVRQLHRCEFLENAQNVVLIGGPGTGKTHIATTLEYRPSRTTTEGFGSSLPPSGSMRSSRKRSVEIQDRSPID